MFRTLGPTLKKLYDRATATGTKNTYASNWNQWIKFCDEFGHNYHCVNNELILSFYATWKFKNTTNKANYIDKTISGIISTFNNQSFNYQIDRKRFNHLRKIINAIETYPGRQSNEAFPIRDPVLKQLICAFKTNYSGILKRTMLAFAKSFALRIGEYTTKDGFPSNRTLTWGDLKFSKKNKTIYLQLNLSKGFKTNRTHKTVNLTRKCCCNIKSPILCSIHWLLIYKKEYKQKFKYDKNQFVFINANGTLVSSSQFTTSLHNALRKIGLDEPNQPRYTSHSLRHGEITDLESYVIPHHLVQKNARHKPGSKVTQQYSHLQGYEDADILHYYMQKALNTI